MKKTLTIIFCLMGGIPGLFAESDGMIACRGAYESQNPWKVFEACGPLIADGDLPEDAIVWDWLSMAERDVRDGDDWKDMNYYRDRSLASGQKTGWAAFKVYDDAKGESERNKAFGETQKFGPWFASYALGRKSGSYDSKEALSIINAAIKLHPNHLLLLARGNIYEKLRKYPSRNDDFMKSIQLAESVGLTDTKAHRDIWYDDPKAMEAYIKDMDPIGQYKRGKFLRRDTAAAVDVCLSNYLGPYETALPACEEAVRASPGDPRGHNYLAATLLKQRNPDFDRVDRELSAALTADPRYARAQMNRGASLRIQGKFNEALAAVQKALVLDPSLAVPSGLTNLGLIHGGLGNFDEAVKNWDLLLARTPWDEFALRGKTIALANASRLEEALKTSAHLLAFKPTENNYELRGDVRSAAGQDLLAAQNYLIAMQMNDAAFKRLFPKWSAARETFLAKQGATNPRNLMEVIAPLPTFVREKGNRAPKFVSNGLRTQWQADGSLRLWTQSDEGIYLLPDGVKYQKALAAGGRGPVESPRETPSGKRIYPLGEFSIAWIPNDSFFFGLLVPLAQSANGRHVVVNGLEYGGPFLYGQSVHRIQEVSRVQKGDVIVLTFTDGLVETTQPGRQARLDIPGAGSFRGDITQTHLPYTGVLTRDDGQWSLVYKGNVLATARQGTESVQFPEQYSQIRLKQDGEVFFSRTDAWTEQSVTYPASGEEPVRYEGKVKQPSWEEYEEGRRKFEEKEALEEALRAARCYVPEKQLRVCFRCNGSGNVWKAGGASQSAAFAPSDMSPSQREEFRNSAGSIRTTYSSGSMVPCPICNGQGSY